MIVQTKERGAYFSKVSCYIKSINNNKTLIVLSQLVYITRILFPM